MVMESILYNVYKLVVSGEGRKSIDAVGSRGLVPVAPT